MRTKHAGFTLLELMVAMSIFLIIGGVTLGLFAQHVPLFNQQQNQSALNIQVRNSIMQLQTDVVNAGSGFITSTDQSSGVLGVTIANSSSTSGNSPTACNTASTYTYPANCFDTLNVINVDTTVAAAHPENGTFTSGYAANPDDAVTTNTGSIYIYPPTGVTAATLLSEYENAYSNSVEHEVLFVRSNGSLMTAVMLSSAPSATTVKNSVTCIQLTYNATNSTGFSTAANDPLNISAVNNGNPKVTNTFYSTDYVLMMAPITYSVSTATASNPQLVRTSGGVSTVLAQQVIGFKVGAMLLDDTTSTCTGDPTLTTDSPKYCYDSAVDTNGGYSSQWTSIRSVQVALIGRTNPNPGSTYIDRNGFDSGPYQIEGVNVVINPRNLSMNDADF